MAGDALREEGKSSPQVRETAASSPPEGSLPTRSHKGNAGEVLRLCVLFEQTKTCAYAPPRKEIDLCCSSRCRRVQTPQSRSSRQPLFLPRRRNPILRTDSNFSALRFKRTASVGKQGGGILEESLKRECTLGSENGPSAALSVQTPGRGRRSIRAPSALRRSRNARSNRSCAAIGPSGSGGCNRAKLCLVCPADVSLSLGKWWK